MTGKIVKVSGPLIVAENLAAGGYNSVAFDIKRADGTIGYRSALATVNAYSAAAYEAADLRSSAAQLAQQDILTVGVVCCYQDDLIPRRDRALALLDRNGVPLEDSQGRTYLNPQSETVYKYLKDIISEARDMGVSIFLLRGTETPSEGSGSTDRFDELCRRLYTDLGTDIKLLRPIDVQVSSSLASRLAGEEDEEKDGEDSQSSYQGGEPTGAAAELLELFFAHGMDIGARNIPDDADNIHPLWDLAFADTESGLNILATLLEHGLDCRSAEILVEHILTDLKLCRVYDDDDKWWRGCGCCSLKMVMLAASYPNILENSGYIADCISLAQNDAARLIGFRDWNRFIYQIDLSTSCHAPHDLYGATVRIRKKGTGEVVWTMVI